MMGRSSSIRSFFQRCAGFWYVFLNFLGSPMIHLCFPIVLGTLDAQHFSFVLAEVGFGALATDRQSTRMAQAAAGLDHLEAFDGILLIELDVSGQHMLVFPSLIIAAAIEHPGRRAEFLLDS